jgi:transposase
VVAAPSKLIRPSGDRVKTDARDAAHLTRLLRLGEITAVTVPEADVEAVRDLVRAREDARADLMRVRHRLWKLLLRQGRVYSGGQAWNGVHQIWLRRQRFDNSHTLDRRCEPAGPRSTRHSRTAGMPVTGACTSSGADSTNAKKSRRGQRRGRP